MPGFIQRQFSFVAKIVSTSLCITEFDLLAEITFIPWQDQTIMTLRLGERENINKPKTIEQRETNVVIYFVLQS